MRFLAVCLAALAAVAVAEPGQYGYNGAGMPGQQIKKQPTMKIQRMMSSQTESFSLFYCGGAHKP